MMAQDFVLERYDWHVRVYYAVTTYWSGRILRDLRRIGCRGRNLERAERNLDASRMTSGG